MSLNVGIELPLDIVTQSNALLGKKGSGKTNAAMALIEEVYAAGAPIVSIDPKGDHWGIRAGSDGKAGGGLPIPVFGGLHGDIPLEPTAGAFIADLVRERRLSVVLDVSEFTASERRRFLTAFAARLYSHPSREPMHLFLEECHEYVPQRVDSGDAAMVGTFERLVKLGRSRGLGVTMISQRSASVNKNVLTQVDNLFVLRTVSPQDRAAVKAWIDTHADSQEILQSLPGLATGEAWLWQPERGDPVRFKFRMRNTYDAGTTPVLGEKPREPVTLADLDLTAISAAMAETIEKAKADDPKLLRARIAKLEKELATRPVEQVVSEVEKIVEVPVLTEDDHRRLSEQSTFLHQAVLDLMRLAVSDVAEAADKIAALATPALPVSKPVAVPKVYEAPAPKAAPMHYPVKEAPTPTEEGELPGLRTGARRMVETLGRMYPLRLTKSQWGMASKMKTTSGTWSSYLSDIRKRGFLDENSIGYTLTPAGFDYLGGQPEPMTPDELQEHYRTILRAGAVRMLDAIMYEYPAALNRQEIATSAEISAASGTFSSYLSDLTRNGLVQKVGGEYVATDLLMKGASA